MVQASLKTTPAEEDAKDDDDTSEDGSTDDNSSEHEQDFINSHVSYIDKKRVRMRKEGSVRERKVLQRNINGVPVCRVMFEKTLGISGQVMKTVLEKSDTHGVVTKGDLRGGPGNRKSHRENVIAHIKLFPTRDSHYCRRETNTRYLHEGLSLKEMYKLYTKWCSEKSEPACILSYYRRIFNTEFNLSFFQRKKDKCRLCEEFEQEVKVSDVKRAVYRERESFKEMDYKDLMKVEIEIEEESDQEEEDEEESTEEEEMQSDETEEDKNNRLVRKVRYHLKEVELTRKLKLSKKVNSSHSREKRIVAHFDLQQVPNNPPPPYKLKIFIKNICPVHDAYQTPAYTYITHSLPRCNN